MKITKEENGNPETTQITEEYNIIANTFLPLFEAISETIKDAEDEILEAPRTFQKKMESRMEEACQTIQNNAPQEQFAETFLQLMAKALPRIPMMMRDMKKSLATRFYKEFKDTPHYASLERLVKDALAVPGTDWRVALGKVDHDTVSKNVLLALSELAAIEPDVGERRAKSALKAMAMISETLYQQYIRTLLRLFRLVRSTQSTERKISKTQKKNQQTTDLPATYGAAFAELLRDGAFEQTYPHLVDPDAVLARNAEAHNRWDYFHVTDEIEMRDIKAAPKRVSVADIIERAHLMLKLSGKLLPDYITLITIGIGADLLGGSEGKQILDQMTTSIQAHIEAPADVRQSESREEEKDSPSTNLPSD